MSTPIEIPPGSAEVVLPLPLSEQQPKPPTTPDPPTDPEPPAAPPAAPDPEQPAP